MAAGAEPSPQDEPFEGHMTVLTDLCYTNRFPLAIFLDLQNTFGRSLGRW
jgi:hypothetical protein